MKRLNELGVQALPVVKMSACNQDYTPQNFLAAGDLVDALLAKVDASSNFNLSDGAPSLRKCGALARIGREFANTKLENIPSRFDGTVIFENQCDKDLGKSIHDCFLIPRNAKPGDIELLDAVHRFAVQRESDTKITEIVCQSDLVMYLHTNRSLIFPEFMGASVAELGLGRSALSHRIPGDMKSDKHKDPSYGIVSVAADTTVIDAFRIMRNNSVSSVAIVTEADGKLLSAFSETDIAYFSEDLMMALGLTVSQFIFLRHNKKPRIIHGVFSGADAYDAALQNPAFDAWRVCCKLEDKLEDVLEMMSQGAVHRIWVCDDDKKPIGCISLVDILAAFQTWQLPEEKDEGKGVEKTTAEELKERVVAKKVAAIEERMQE
jgi:CBS domain-containing protein